MGTEIQNSIFVFTGRVFSISHKYVVNLNPNQDTGRNRVLYHYGHCVVPQPYTNLSARTGKLKNNRVLSLYGPDRTTRLLLLLSPHLVPMG